MRGGRETEQEVKIVVREGSVILVFVGNPLLLSMNYRYTGVCSFSNQVSSRKKANA